MIAVNSVEELKYRIVDGHVVSFPTIRAGATIGREDGTFGFAFSEIFNRISKAAG